MTTAAIAALAALWIFRVVNILVLAFVGWAFVACFTRRSVDFRYTSRNKQFWMGVLGGALVFTALTVILPFRLPFQNLLLFASVFAALFYLGPVESKMGPRSKRK